MPNHAAEFGYGIPALNVNNLKQVQVIMEAAQATDSSVILQASAGLRKYAGKVYSSHLILAAVELHPDIRMVRHQDHGTSPRVHIQSMCSGSTSAMMDCSMLFKGKTPFSYSYSYSYNVEVTRRVSDMAK